MSRSRAKTPAICAAIAAWFALSVAIAACTPEAPPDRGIRSRVSVDRTQTRVGDAVGVTIEVETPERFSLEVPVAPGDDAFFTDSIEQMEPIEIPGGLRHHLLWTVRAREVGEASLPTLDLGLVRPDGEIQRMRVGGVPLAVRSVRDTLPDREVFFDIRSAPPPDLFPAWVWAAAAGACVTLAMVVLALWIRFAHRESETPPGARELAAAACQSIEDALEETDTRHMAARIEEAILVFVGEHWSVAVESCTPSDLPENIDRDLVRMLHSLESARFQASPTREPLLETARDARERIRHVAIA